MGFCDFEFPGADEDEGDDEEMLKLVRAGG
jgi:hypothetical protein